MCHPQYKISTFQLQMFSLEYDPAPNDCSSFGTMTTPYCVLVQPFTGATHIAPAERNAYIVAICYCHIVLYIAYCCMLCAFMPMLCPCARYLWYSAVTHYKFMWLQALPCCIALSITNAYCCLLTRPASNMPAYYNKHNGLACYASIWGDTMK